MLNRQPPTITVKECYETSISKVKNPGLKARLVAATPDIVRAGADYLVLANAKTLHTFPRTAPFAGCSKDELNKVYTGRMVPKKGPGRDIYLKIRDAGTDKKCPLCVQRKVKTLDHHLPKAAYPSLSVTPLNLVPSCIDCNLIKQQVFPTLPGEVGLHPYFDFIDDVVWLEATVQKTNPTVLIYGVQKVPAWDPVLQARVENHFRTLALNALYQSEATEELDNIRFQLQDLLAKAGPDQVRAELVSRALSCAKVRPNGWRAAAFRAWASDLWFYNGGFAT